MPVRTCVLLFALCCVPCAKPAQADLLIYKVPGQAGAEARPGAPDGAAALDAILQGNLPAGAPLDKFPAGALPPRLAEMLSRRAGAQQALKPTEMKLVFQGRFQVSGKQVSYTHPGQREQMVFQLEDRQ